MRVCWNRQTGTFEGRVSNDVRVQVPSSAPYRVFITDLKLWTLDFSYLIFMYGAGLNPAPFCYAAYAGTPFGLYFRRGESNRKNKSG